MEDEEHLDISWIEENNKLESISQNYFREPMDAIDVFFIYINPESFIEKIVCEKEVLQIIPNLYSEANGIPKERILQMIQNKRHLAESGKKYKLIDILTFVVDLDHDHIPSYSSDNSCNFLKNPSIFDDIEIPSSIFLFHNINSIYFFFKETDTNTNHTKNTNIKSILKTNDVIDPNKRVTKKVHIHIPIVSSDKRKSFKIIPIKSSRNTKKKTSI